MIEWLSIMYRISFIMSGVPSSCKHWLHYVGSSTVIQWMIKACHLLLNDFLYLHIHRTYITANTSHIHHRKYIATSHIHPAQTSHISSPRIHQKMWKMALPLRYIYIYICMERERERCVYIYIYIHISVIWIDRDISVCIHVYIYIYIHSSLYMYKRVAWACLHAPALPARRTLTSGVHKGAFSNLCVIVI